MTLPAGLASHSLAMDDSPHARGAIAACRSMAERREAEMEARVGIIANACQDRPKLPSMPARIAKAHRVPRVAVALDRLIDRHAALVINAGYRLKDA